MKTIGIRIRERRLERGETQQVFAQSAGIGQATLSDIEAGRRQPTVDVALKIARYIGTSIDWLIEGREYRPSDNSIKTGLNSAPIHLPLYLSPASAGQPSPAGSDYVMVDLMEMLAPHPEMSYVVRVVGDSMINAGIMYGDYVVVDRSVKARNGDIVVAVVDGETCIKRLEVMGERTWLYPANEHYQAIDITERSGAVQGVVGPVIRGVDRWRK